MNGNRIREARHKLGYTLADVAEKTGYTIGFISQIERDLKEPSLCALRKIADCLECSEVWLMMGDDIHFSHDGGAEAGEPGSGYVIKKGKRPAMKMPDIVTEYEIITPRTLPNGKQAKMTGLTVRLDPGFWVTEKMICHKNMDECVFVLKGSMNAYVGEEIQSLSAGDCLYIPEQTMHNYVNNGDCEMIALVYFSDLIY